MNFLPFGIIGRLDLAACPLEEGDEGVPGLSVYLAQIRKGIALHELAHRKHLGWAETGIFDAPVLVHIRDQHRLREGEYTIALGYAAAIIGRREEGFVLPGSVTYQVSYRPLLGEGDVGPFRQPTPLVPCLLLNVSQSVSPRS